ncbi:MAG: 2-oxo acid dehydrogenase subunit E2 [Gemmataceae bacterium]|nr:2-oxo acid dehydrogenase subunit E2 [Gemmataceae bacterium]
MAIPITVPRLGWNMEQGVFVGWLKADGDTIRVGDSLFTLEGEKAAEDVECLDAGALHIPANAPQPGETVLVGALLGYLLQPGESPPKADSPPMPVAAAAEPAVVKAIASPAIETTPRERPASSPRARRVAEELNVDWKQAKGSGHSGRIREKDVRALAEAGTSFGNATRRLIAERMVASQKATAPVTLVTTVDATELVQFRDRCKANGSAVPSYTDLLVKLCAAALERHPALNARWENDRVVPSAGIRIGIAVDTDGGLLVPVIRDAAKISLAELTVQSRDLIERARAGKLSGKELRGGTFTVSSLGGFGIDAFTPIINLPECAVLGMGRIRRVPVVVDDQIAIRDQVTLSLTFDHRIVDGAPAARFLQTLTKLVEAPTPTLDSLAPSPSGRGLG